MKPALQIEPEVLAEQISEMSAKDGAKFFVSLADELRKRGQHQLATGVESLASICRRYAS